MMFKRSLRMGLGMFFAMALLMLTATGAFAASEPSYERISIGEAPEKVQDWANPYLHGENTEYLHYDGHTYALVTMGPQPTSGYSVEVTKVAEINPGTVGIGYTYHYPAPDEPVLQVFTYPYALVEIDGNYRSVLFAGP